MSCYWLNFSGSPLQIQIHLPWEICTSATKRSLRGNLCGFAARSAMALNISFQSAANSSGRSRPRTALDGTVRMMFSNSNSAQGEGAVRSKDHSAAVVTPEENKRWVCQISHARRSTNLFCQKEITQTGPQKLMFMI